MSEIQVIAHYAIAAGHEDSVLALVLQMRDAVRTEPGNVSFVAYRQLDDPRQVVLLERYASPEALVAHRESPHFTAIVLEQIVPLLVSREVEQYDVP